MSSYTSVPQCLPMHSSVGREWAMPEDTDMLAYMYTCMYTFTSALRDIRRYRDTCLHANMHIHTCTRVLGIPNTDRCTYLHICTVGLGHIRGQTHACIHTHIHKRIGVKQVTHTVVNMCTHAQGLT